MALGRVLLLFFLLHTVQNAGALSLDLEGLKDQALSHITGPKLMEIVCVRPSVMLVWKSHESISATISLMHMCAIRMVEECDVSIPSLADASVMQLLS